MPQPPVRTVNTLGILDPSEQSSLPERPSERLGFKVGKLGVGAFLFGRGGGMWRVQQAEENECTGVGGGGSSLRLREVRTPLFQFFPDLLGFENL